MESVIKEEKLSAKKDNILINLLFNVAIPVVLLSKFSKAEYLGPALGLTAALLFPLAYGIYDYIKKKKKNVVSILGFVSILLTGVVGLFKFPPEMIAVKEALIPFLIGIFNLASLNTKYPFVKTFIFNREIFNVERIELLLREKEKEFDFERVLIKASLYLSGSFFFSAALNYILAKIMVTAMPGTLQFNEELGQMALLSYPVIALPSVIITAFIFMYIVKSIKTITGLRSKEIFSEQLGYAVEEE